MRVSVKFDVEIPKTDQDPTDDEIEEWLRYCLRDNGCMKIANPLSHHEPEPIFGTFDWTERKARLRVPPTARLAVMQIGLYGAIGEVSYDDIKVSAASERQ